MALFVLIEAAGKTYEYGPYVSIEKGPYTDFVGVNEDGARENLFEFTVGQGGYCDTCAYEYVSVHLSKENKYGLDVPSEDVHFKIVVR